MLLTKDWTLKLTDFGEARAANLGATMTSVGTPIYIAPEVMRADHYDQKADTWSYGLCLVAMIRADKNIQEVSEGGAGGRGGGGEEGGRGKSRPKRSAANPPLFAVFLSGFA
jgi:hypothetical protein